MPISKQQGLDVASKYLDVCRNEFAKEQTIAFAWAKVVAGNDNHYVCKYILQAENASRLLIN